MKTKLPKNLKTATYAKLIDWVQAANPAGRNQTMAERQGVLVAALVAEGQTVMATRIGNEVF